MNYHKWENFGVEKFANLANSYLLNTALHTVSYSYTHEVHLLIFYPQIGSDYSPFSNVLPCQTFPLYCTSLQ